MKIIELYKEILAAGYLYADKEGMISARIKGSTMPFLIDGKRLVLPTKEHLKNSDWSNRVVFHPLSENILRGESKVLERFRNNINMRLNYVLGMLADQLFKLVVNVGGHKHLSPDQSVILSDVKNADEKAYTAFGNLIEDMGLTNKSKCIVHIYLKKGGVVDGKKYNRAAIVTFPLYEELLKNQKQVFGVTIASAKHREAIKQLLEFILPGIEKPHYFDRGSESQIAPYLDCLMQGVLGIASRINNVIDEYGQFLDSTDDLRYTDGWVEVFENLEQLKAEIRSIPMQAGNEGSIGDTATPAPAATATTAVQQPVAAQPALQMPTAIPVPPPIQPSAPGYYGAPAPAPQSTGGVVKSSSGGIDFAATMHGNPQQMANMGNPGYPQYGQPALPPGPIAARMGPPRWDRPDQYPQQQYQQYPQYPQQYPQQLQQPQYPQQQYPQNYPQRGY